MTESLFRDLDTAVYFLCKRLADDTLLTCRVDLMPNPCGHRVGCAFSLELACGSERVCETVEAPDCGIAEAERIFNLICVGNVHPTKLRCLVERPRTVT